MMGGYIFVGIGRMSVNNFLAPFQVRLSPNFVSHTLGHRGRDDFISEGQGRCGRYAIY